MQVVILHLSDLHIKGGVSALRGRSKAVVGSLREHCLEASCCVIALTGDVAWSGEPEEYRLALDYLKGLKQSIAGLGKDGLEVPVVVVPGNHDCSFEMEHEARRQLLTSQIPEDKLLQDESIIQQFVSVQDAFFDFASDLTSEEYSKATSRMAWSRTVECSGLRVGFRCYNTAWRSRKKEVQGQLRYPPALVGDADGSCEVVVCLFHHPYGWLDADNGKEFRKRIELAADVVLTGHEHDGDTHAVIRSGGDTTSYVEGGILQGKGDTPSSYNIVILDPDERKYRVLSYRWEGGVYSASHDVVWQGFVRRRSLPGPPLSPSPDFLESLNDTEVVFSHPAKLGGVRLEDLFVMPGLMEVNPDPDVDSLDGTTHEGTDALSWVFTKRRALIVGDEKSGKTALAKMLCLRALARGYVPVLVQGAMLRGKKTADYLNTLHSCFVDQYSKEELDRYKQLDPSRKLIVIDDFDKSRLNTSYKARVLETFDSMVEHVVVLAGELLQLEEIRQRGGGGAFTKFAHCSIREFGHLLRDRLITKWVTLGREDTLADEEIAFKVKQITQSLNTLLGKNLVPKRPFFILTLLQAIDAAIPSKTTSGTFAYYYEAVIIEALAKVSRTEDMDLRFAVLEELAFHLFVNRKRQLSQSEIDTVFRAFLEERLMRVPGNTIKELVKARILRQKDDGYVFSYDFVYYYFVGRYLSRNMHDPDKQNEVQRHIGDMVSSLYNEDHGNIVLFLCYHSYEQSVVQRVVEAAERINSGVEPCDLDSDLVFAEKLLPVGPKLTLSPGDPKKKREEMLRQQDEAEEHRKRQAEEQSDDELAEFEQVRQFHAALKTLQIMGQTLKNFTSLKAAVKKALTKESYRLGLRTLKAILAAMQEYLDLCREYATGLLVEAGEPEDEELPDKANRVLHFMTLCWCYFFLKKISAAVGSERFRELYEAVAGELSGPAYRLVNIFIRLENFAPIPGKDIVRLYRDLRSGSMAQTLLKLMVKERFELYPSSYRTRQSLCAQLALPESVSKSRPSKEE